MAMEVKNLYLGDQLIDSQYYSVSKDGEITLKNSYLSGLAAGEYTVRVTYDPLEKLIQRVMSRQ